VNLASWVTRLLQSRHLHPLAGQRYPVGWVQGLGHHLHPQNWAAARPEAPAGWEGRWACQEGPRRHSLIPAVGAVRRDRHLGDRLGYPNWVAAGLALAKEPGVLGLSLIHISEPTRH